MCVIMRPGVCMFWCTTCGHLMYSVSCEVYSARCEMHAKADLGDSCNRQLQVVLYSATECQARFDHMWSWKQHVSVAA